MKIFEVGRKIVFFAVVCMCFFLAPDSADATGSISCSGIQGICRESCLTSEDPVAGNYYDCINGRTTCCKSIAAPTTPTTPTAPTTPATPTTPRNATNPTTTTTGGGQSVDFPNPISANSASEFLGNILSALQGIVAIIAIIFIIVGAVMYMVAGGNEKTIDKAKATITGAVVGLAIVLAAPTFLKELLEIFGNQSGGDPNQIVNQALTLQQIAIRVLNFLLSIVGILAIIGMIVGGARYLTAYGDEDRMDSGKKILTGSVIGIAIAFAALLIVRQIANLFGV